MDEIEEIKRRLDIVDLISSYLTLKKAGANYRALCPFHKEHTPSFMVSKEKQIFKCFGCSLGGDVFAFIMQMENLTFPEALKLLADKTGVKLQRRKQADLKISSVKNKLYQINLLAAKLYHKILTQHSLGKKPLVYLTAKRQLKDQTISEFMLGYAPKSWDLILKKLQEKGFSQEEIAATGLLVRKEGDGYYGVKGNTWTYYDRFRDRIIFPIFDALGNVVGFSARTIEDEKDVPKYVNSADSPIFHKSRILYGLNLAKSYIKKNGFVILVEGQMDVIGSWQARVKNIVASSGTSLTEEHLSVLKRYTQNLILALDADSAGIEATKKVIDAALLLGFSVKVTKLAGFKDPGEAAINSPSNWIEALKKSLAAIDWFFDLALTNVKDKDNLTISEKKTFAKIVLEPISKIQNPIEKAHYASQVAEILQVKEEVVSATLEKYNSQQPQPVAGAEEAKKSDLGLEEYFLGLVLAFPKFLPQVISKIQTINFNDELPSQIAKQLLTWYNINRKNLERGSFKFDLNQVFKGQLLDKVNLLIFDLEEQFQEKEDEEILQEIIQVSFRLRQSQREDLKKEYALKIAQAEKAGDRTKLKSLIAEFQNALSEKEK
ncbi:MAG: DNA primase [Candidatus Nealsonbacteria bacterium CG23_combo_of_CG06-09_8_20_14_all_40_13]|uniref:DNA primase n=1 Tax=Candidatus Nealsonbacteria bacterium CG23_combo_of_CG06-09_8_20_14_all_40_13 TaxID=1974724 RepID=A0A2G9YQR8_9BACT|nr:MAG: DNA primase [Candidatus Nealsonbacteria bacterium CG23_combo_of_CG06-09_8_20_14_all_40_13]PIR70817.1 MAG: DNA primase [Candidatus Nealsonbacteria bacterium CG10_big_fil_rev_8_21_14_0_10_40_24]PIU43330.1 MAG: DNA primase [Candidatus Nealsonbacteria bacterium CG07_land_8_20_14_0_80_40_10]